MNNVTIICPFIFEQEVTHIKAASVYLDAEVLLEHDANRIGADMMYQRLWKKAAPNDIIILHSDMTFTQDPAKWFNDLIGYVNKYPEAGIIGCKLLYPLKNDKEQFLIQSAGGCFVNNRPEHYGSGVDMFTNKMFKEVEPDTGQYDCVREVAWTTFGGLYIRRQVLEEVGDFDPKFEWSYNRDVDYCLMARDKGWKIYQVPVPLYHFESKDVKRTRTAEQAQAEARNLIRLQNKWQSKKDLFTSIDIRVDNG